MGSLLLFKNLSRRYSTPQAVQKLIRTFAYNQEKSGPSVRSALSTWKLKRAHCLEASFLAAAILEHRGYPPLVMSLESKDGLDHVLFIFREKGKWGAISRSREDGLHGRAPVFLSLRALALSYYDSFIDETGKLTGYGIANLDEMNCSWRDSNRNVEKAEKYLIDMPHKKIRSSLKRYFRLLKLFRLSGQTSKLKKNRW
ncbi:MAG: hypothetical protein SGI74_13700 [Oligoflexia bacterium]|nr:hypothetical protein [Oligoflexia bacterium]